MLPGRSQQIVKKRGSRVGDFALAREIGGAMHVDGHGKQAFDRVERPDRLVHDGQRPYGTEACRVLCRLE